MSDKSSFDMEKALEEVSKILEQSNERERAERGKRVVAATITVLVMTVLGAALLGIAVRVFIAFSGLG